MSQSHEPMDEDDVPTWDTPLHDAIELTALSVDDGDRLIISHPRRYADEWIDSDQFSDTYDRR